MNCPKFTIIEGLEGIMSKHSATIGGGLLIMKGEARKSYISFNIWVLFIAAITAFLLLMITNNAMAGSGYITGSVVNVRSGPGTGYPVSGNLYQDTEVTILEKGDGWHKIQKNQLVGWVSSSLLKIEDPLTLLRVKEDLVNLRSGPGTAYSRVGQAVKGDILTLLGSEGEWYRVSTARGIIAYIAAFLVEPAEDIAMVQEKKVQVNDGPVNLRKGPGTNYDRVGSAQDKEILTVISQEGEWYQVRTASGTQAYIASWLVSEVKNSPVTSQPELSPPKVFLDNQLLTFEVAPIIEEGRTLVPLRAIFEAMGAVVSWDDRTRTVTATKGDTAVILPIGSTKPTVNGQVWEIEVPARIVQDRTLAPLRFVGEAFGGQVDWDGNSRTINIATAAKSDPAKITAVKANGEVSLHTGPSTTYDSLGVARAGERLVVLQEVDGWYQVSRSGMVAWVPGWDVDICEDAEDSGTGDEPPSPPSNEGGLSGTQPYIFDIYQLNAKGNENAEAEAGYISLATKLTPEGYRLVMKTKEKTEPEITVLNNGKKILYTFKGVKLKAGRDEANFYLGTATNERIIIDAVSLDDTTWVTIHRPIAYEYLTFAEEDGAKQVFLIPSQLKDVREMTLNNGNHIITIKSYASMNISEQKDGDILAVRLSGTYKGLVQPAYELEGAGASRVELTELEKDQLELKIRLKEIKTYQTTSNVNQDTFSIIIVPENPVVKPQKPDEPDKTTAQVVLDPGHGGGDPGAIGYSRTLYEKEVNFKIAGKAKALLEKEGIKVIMTRSTDVRLDLNEIPQIANRANADVFVSIHCNGHTIPDKCGTETYYYAPEDNPTLAAQELQRSLLANMLQKKLAEKLGRANRGVKQANYAVLRGTNMPSALVEVAFITNPEEESLLRQDHFQEKAARAIAEAIVEYLKIMK
jgi:N-acetylmuramoyl-L-alanine amidase